MLRSILLLAVLLLLLVVCCSDIAEAKPKVGIIHMHGVLEGWFEHVNARKWISKKSGIPIKDIHLLNEYNYAHSLVEMNEQVKYILPNVKAIAANYDHIIAIGYSQGGLIWRAMIEEWDGHNVDIFISLASPQGGVFGVPTLAAQLIPLFDWYARTTIYKILYTGWAQTFSIFNYFCDPRMRKQHLEYSAFLPYVNNEKGADEERQRKKDNFTSLRKLILIGGKDEDIIDPWQSTMFGFYTETGHEDEVVEMEELDYYKRDLFGLKTLADRKAIDKCRYDGLSHLQFRDNKDMLNACILPAIQDTLRTYKHALILD